MVTPPSPGPPEAGYAVPPAGLASRPHPGHSAPPGYPARPGYPPPPTAPSGEPLPDFGQRFLAYLLDGVIIGVVAMVFILPPYVWWLLTAMNRMNDLAAPSADTAVPGDVFAEIFLPLFGVIAFIIVAGGAVTYLYQVELMFRTGQTVGKRVMKLRVVPLDPGATLTRGQAARRWLVQWGGGTFIPAFSYLDGLWQLWDKPYRQCLHDKWPGTVVVKLPG